MGGGAAPCGLIFVFEHANAMQRALAKELDEVGETDGFVHVELGELALIRDDDKEVRRQFARAWELLSKNQNYVVGNAEALQRMKTLGEID